MDLFAKTARKDVTTFFVMNANYESACFKCNLSLLHVLYFMMDEQHGHFTNSC